MDLLISLGTTISDIMNAKECPICGASDRIIEYYRYDLTKSYSCLYHAPLSVVSSLSFKWVEEKD